MPIPWSALLLTLSSTYDRCVADGSPACRSGLRILAALTFFFCLLLTPALPTRAQDPPVAPPDAPRSMGWFPELLDLDALTFAMNGEVRVHRAPVPGENGGTVLVRDNGPGVLVRIWFADPESVGDLQIFVDGEKEPSLALSGKSLFAGGAFPFLAPFAMTQGDGAGVFSFPIAYRLSVRVEATGKVENFRALTRKVESGTRLLGFDRTALDFFAGEVLDASGQLNQRKLGEGPGGEDLDDLTLARTEGRGPGGQKPYEIGAGEEKTIYRWQGAAVIRKILLRVRGRDEPLRTVTMSMYWDGRTDPCVQCPIGDFFLTGISQVDGGGLISGYREGSDVYYSRWPMPFRAGAEIKLRNEGSGPIWVDLAVETGVNDRALEREYYFHASYHLGDPTADEFVVGSAQGKGHYVGSNLSVVWDRDEGEKPASDETAKTSLFTGGAVIVLDGKDLPVSGSGLDSLYGASVGSAGSGFSTPFQGVLLRSEKGLVGFRQRVADRIPFQRSFRMKFLRGPDELAVRQLSGCAFWYQEELTGEGMDVHAIAHHDLPPVAERRAGWDIARRSRSARSRRQGIEMHLLPVVNVRGGAILRESAVTNGPGFSGDDYLLFSAQKEGSFLEMDLTLKKAGKFRIHVWPANGPEMGIWNLSVDGEVLGDPYDGYSEELQSPDSHLFGVRELTAGPHRVRLTVVSGNEASQGLFVGADLLSLELVK